MSNKFDCFMQIFTDEIYREGWRRAEIRRGFRRTVGRNCVYGTVDIYGTVGIDGTVDIYGTVYEGLDTLRREFSIG